MQTVLLTIVGPERAIDLRLPTEVPVSELEPRILELCGLRPERDQRPGGRWRLFLASSGVSLHAAQSLDEAGVVDGSILLLSDRDRATQPQQQRSRPFNPRTIQRGENSSGIGVKWHIPNS